MPNRTTITPDGLRKKCKNCGETKVLAEFYLYKRTGYYDSACNPCRKGACQGGGEDVDQGVQRREGRSA